MDGNKKGQTKLRVISFAYLCTSVFLQILFLPLSLFSFKSCLLNGYLSRKLHEKVIQYSVTIHTRFCSLKSVYSLQQSVTEAIFYRLSKVVRNNCYSLWDTKLIMMVDVLLLKACLEDTCSAVARCFRFIGSCVTLTMKVGQLVLFYRWRWIYIKAIAY